MSVSIRRSVGGRFLAVTLLTIALFVPSPASPDFAKAQPGAPNASTAAEARAQVSYAKLPLAFEPNRGHADQRVKFLAHGPGYTLALSPTEATLVLTRVTSPIIQPTLPAASKHLDPKSLIPNTETRALTIRLLGANRATRIEGVEKLPGISNYFIGNDRSRWHSKIPNYAKVRYASVYPGVDLIYYGTQGQLEYDLVLAPRANPGAIKFAIDGADKLDLNPAGDLVMHAGGDQLVLRKPVVYQQVAGRRKEIAGRFRWTDERTLGFEIASYDRDQPLIIDPGLVYSTYIGGFLATGHGIAVDSAGSAYIVGLSALCFCLPPTQVPYPTTPGAYNYGASQTSFAVGVSKLKPDGSGLVYSTYFGGTNFDAAYGIALDPSGNAYVTGFTLSNDFPTANTSIPNGSTLHGIVNVFVTELNSSGSSLVYSTYLGSSVSDGPLGIAVDGGGSAYVVGSTESTDFPTTSNAFQQTNPQTGTLNFAGFLSKLSVSSGVVGLAYSTYVANGVANAATLPVDGDVLSSVAVDEEGNAYVAGWSGPNFPVTTGQTLVAQPSHALVARFDTTQAGSASLNYARYLAGSGFDVAYAVGLVPSCASNCNAYVGGLTSSADFPVTAGAAQSSFRNGPARLNGFVAEIGPAGAVTYATYVGGSNAFVRALGVDGAGQVYAAGNAASADFPTTATAFQPSFQAPLGALFRTTTSAFPNSLPTGWNMGAPGLTSIALDPATSPATIYVASVREGIFKSADGAATFNPTAFNIAGATSIAINTNTTPHTLYWGTSSGQVLESNDGLSTYSSAGALPAGTEISVVATDVSVPSSLYVGTTTGFYTSSNGGATFTAATGLPPAINVNAAVTDGAGNLFIGTNRGIFKSANGGGAFAATNMTFLTTVTLAADKINHIVYAGTYGFVVSSNDGFNSNFVFGSIEAADPRCWSIAVDPENPSTIYAGIRSDDTEWSRVDRSTDSGHTFFPGFGRIFQGMVTPIAIDNTTPPETIYWGENSDLDAFLTQLSADGSTILFSTYLGGSNPDNPRGVAVDSSGSAYVIGSTRSADNFSYDFPTTPGAYQTSLGNGGPGFQNIFVAKYPNTLPSSTGTTTTTPSSTTAVTFSSLTSSGTTTVTASNTGPPPPAGFQFNGTYYDFTTTATFSGNLTVCVDYIPANFSDPSLLQLFHYQNGAWAQVTTSNDTTNGVICGTVSSLSPFAIGDQNEPLSKDNCKEGAWQLWKNPAFKNQGQCIKFVNHS